MAAVSGLAGAALAPRPAFSTGFVTGARVSARNPLMTRNLERNGRITCMTFQRDWLRRDLNVIGFGLIGWIAPSSIPVIDGNSLTGLFFSSIGQELSHFPTPPALDSQFWSDQLSVAASFTSSYPFICIFSQITYTSSLIFLTIFQI
ncbi:hypothetical protein ABZP36_007568 [Zizania latifolia]